jgi:aryl-alcohol dehydrogenase-like predicted oxidoreductase
MNGEQPNAVPSFYLQRMAAPLRPNFRRAEMELIEIAGPDMLASRIALGTWAIGGWMWGGSDVKNACRTIQAALDHGVNLIDTAPVYGFGLAEEIVGRALVPNGQRRRVLIATKCGLEWRGNKVHRNAAPSRIRQEIEDSLKRLRTSYIDLYQLHWPDPLVPIEESAGALAKLLQEGKIRAIGVSNLDPVQTEQFRQVVPLCTTQPPYNLFEREIEADVLPYAAQTGLVLLAYGALCRGLLSGRMSAATRFEGDDLRRVDPKFQQPRFAQYLTAVAALERFARANFGRSVLALAVRWILDRGRTIALWGARRPEQLAEIGQAMGWSLDNAAMREIDRILDQTVANPVGPGFMAPPEVSPRRAVA